MQHNKDDLSEFAQTLFDNLNIDETQKIVFQSMFQQALDGMTNADFENFEKQVKEFVNRPKAEPNVFD